MKYDVFISYSSKNIETALAICHVLESNNIRCWMAPRNIPAGADYGDVIDVAITECKVFLLLYSEPATISPWVKGELNLAFTEGKHIIPYRIDQTPLKGAMKLMLNQRHWIDAHPDANDEFRSLVDSILPIVNAGNINLKKDADATKINKSTTKTQSNIVGNNDGLGSPTSEGKSVEKGAIIHIKPDMDCRVVKFGEDVGHFKANKFNVLHLAKGRYILDFISLEHEIDHIEITYEIKDNNFEDFFTIELCKIRDQRLKAIVKTQEQEIKQNSNVGNDIISDEIFEPYISKGGCGYIRNGAQMLSLKYNYAYSFSEGLARVVFNGKWGFINKAGKEIIPLKYDGIYSFSEGLAVVRQGDFMDDKYGFIDKAGREITSLKYDYMSSFSEGLAMVELKDKYGFIDKTGEEIISLRYDYVGSFSEGIAGVRLKNKYGFIDKAGNKITSLKYSEAEPFHEGLAKVRLKNKYGFIDKTGKETISLKYDDVDSFSEGLAKVKLNGKWGFINKAGDEIIAIKYSVAFSFVDGVARVWTNGNIVFIDKTGAVILSSNYYDVDNFSEGLAKVKSNGKYGFIDKTGKVIIQFRYDEADSFSEGLARAKLDGRWGFIDKVGKEVIPLKYSSLYEFCEGLAEVKLNGKYGRIDKQGNEYWE